ncbi:exonuclease domain-containing protein [Sphaerotilus sp.]|uniref:3'-5' exonuclease n=1 Tax=Sphaerotilus sp. TaxID=2093942 RepID=UPI002ACE5F78|nr:exonuclease domain-containing protein [Sphaerotilus sp.]MDZ7857315.1 exonuclease domain-containing protein [Sphaerotilus sp.]
MSARRPIPGARRAIVLGMAVVAAGLLLWAGVSTALVVSTLEDTERTWLAEHLLPRLPLLLLTMLAMLGLAAWAAGQLWRRGFSSADALLEDAQVLLTTDVERELVPRGTPAQRGLAQAFNELVRQRRRLREDMALQVREASQHVEQERNRLAALMSELKQSVVVCNLDGRILLYNSQARQQFRALSSGPSVADGADVIGLGRSIYSVLDRHLVAHALERAQDRLLRGDARPAAQFVTTTLSAQMLRVHLTPVQSGPQGGAPVIDGFVLMVDNITRDFEQESTRDQQLNEMMESQRAALGNLQAAVEVLDYGDIDTATRERFLAVIREEALRMGDRVAAWSQRSARDMGTRWPLEEMHGADLVTVAQRRLAAQPGLRVSADEVDAEVWLKVDSYSLLLALVYLADRLVSEHEVRQFWLRLRPAGTRAQLDLVWMGQSMSTETVMSWEMDNMRVGDEGASTLTVRDVVQRHGGEFWFERERVRHQAFFRFLLPCAEAPVRPAAGTAPVAFVHSQSRPEYYDFDLFAASGAGAGAGALDEMRLIDLAYTVFDTETTGLNPSEGDEILQIGAARVVNGKLLRQESFEQLVDPQRSIPAASIPIHGIQPEMVKGQPTIERVLPAFHAFARDTVLVAHNAAFDLRFLQIKESLTGLRFDHPVLDTLLLSAVVHPHQDSHRLEAIAERFQITVIGRHTALGDAMVTAEVFLRLIPLLADKGIHTLGQARQAQQQSYFARLKY